MPATTRAALDTHVVEWSGRLRLGYRFTNDTDEDLIVFDGAFAGTDDFVRVARTERGIRLFKGRAVLPGVTATSEQLVGGRLVPPGVTVEGLGAADLPLIVPASDGTGPATEESPDEIEFCIGFSSAELALPTMLGNGEYAVTRDVELQELVCERIARP